MTDLPLPDGTVEAGRTTIAYLLWCINEGYTHPEDRAIGGGNWMNEDPATLHPNDVKVRGHLLLMADEILAEIAPPLRAQGAAAERARLRRDVNSDGFQATIRAYSSYDYTSRADAVTDAVLDLLGGEPA